MGCRLNYDRYKTWSNQDQKQAAFAFYGPAYKALSAEALDKDSRQYSQQHLRILCGLYGFLRPLRRYQSIQVKSEGGQLL